MDLKALPKIKIATEKKRVGRGHATGKGKTAGRGQKGQKARGKVRVGFEGGQTPLYQRLPFQKGKGHRKISLKPVGVNIALLAKLPAHTTVTVTTLVDAGIVDKALAEQSGVKLLGNGKLTQALVTALPYTKQARIKIEQAGGSVQEGAA